MKDRNSLNITIVDLSQKLSAILNKNGYDYAKIIPKRNDMTHYTHYGPILRKLEFVLKEYELIYKEKHVINQNIIDFYEGLWYIKNNL